MLTWNPVARDLPAARRPTSLILLFLGDVEYQVDDDGPNEPLGTTPV